MVAEVEATTILPDLSMCAAPVHDFSSRRLMWRLILAALQADAGVSALQTSKSSKFSG